MSARTVTRRVVIALCVVLSLVLVTSIAGFGYATWRYSQVHKIDLASVLSNGGTTSTRGPMNILVVGSDTRAGLAAGESSSFGSASKVAGQRSDTMMVVHLDPESKSVSILSLPRDLWVPIAGTSGSNRLNTSYDNGPQQLIQTIEQDFRVPIDHYIEMDFDGFRNIVNTIGGVSIDFSAPARDWGYDAATGTTHNISGLNVLQTGCVKLSGDQALGYVRSRHYQALINGKWVSDPESDLSRIQRQQNFVRQTWATAIAKVGANPIAINNLISAGIGSVTVDSQLSLSNVASLARTFHSFNVGQVRTYTLPSTSAVVDQADVLRLQQPEATQTIDTFLSGSGGTSSSSSTPTTTPGASNTTPAHGVTSNPEAPFLPATGTSCPA